jgi:hypothetical protein
VGVENFPSILSYGRVIGVVCRSAVAFPTRAALQLEILALRDQLGALQRSVKKPKLNRFGQMLWTWFCGRWTAGRSALYIVKPDTVLAWHRQGFRLFWIWKIRRGQPGCPPVPMEVRKPIRQMSRDNALWGVLASIANSPLGIDIGETSVSKYMVRHRNPPSQTWRTFVENHLKPTVSIDFFTVPTLRFQLLYVFLVLAHERRRIVHFNVTAHPTPEWTAQQLREAFPFLSKFRSICCAIAMESSVRTSLSRPRI